MNISEYSYYRLYRDAEARMEREIEARRAATERLESERRDREPCGQGVRPAPRTRLAAWFHRGSPRRSAAPAGQPC